MRQPSEIMGMTAVATPKKVRGRLFRKYVALFVAVVSIALLANGLLEIWFSYDEHRASLVRIQREQAQAAAAKIGQFIKEIEGQIGWTTQLPWTPGASLEQRRFDALRLLRQVPAITEIAQLDSTGHEQLLVSRLAMDVIGSGADLAKEPKFTEAVAHRIYYGPVYFRRESEPYMTLAMAGAGRDAGVSVAEVNLKFIGDVVSQIKVGQHGHAFVVDANNRLIAHPDISLVLRNTDLSELTQVKAARGRRAGGETQEVQEANDLEGHPVLTANAPVDPLGWLVFVELPADEAYAPLYTTLERSGLVLLSALALAFFAGTLLARRMVIPIHALRSGAARIGSGDLGQRIAIKTGDELEALADQFNDMAGRLQESYADLEKKVEARTKELSESLDQQTATSEVLRVIGRSPGDLTPIFETLLANATRICEANFGILYRFDGDVFRAEAVRDAAPEYVNYLRHEPPRPDPRNEHGRLLQTKQPVHVTDIRAEPAYADGEPTRVATVETAGARTLLAVPMLKEEELIGGIVIYRKEVRPFTAKQIELVTSFASQAVIAIENVRLLTELHARTDELARSVEELRALGEVSEAVNSTLDLEMVLATIVAKAVQLSGAEAGTIYVFDDARQEFEPRATHGMDEAIVTAIRERHVGIDTAIGEAATRREPIQLADVQEASSPVLDIIVRAGYRALLIVPLLRPHRIVGALVVRRMEPGEFPKSIVDLLETFAAQSVLAIQNARLFHEINEKGRELEVASRHKSQFLANMSHELRTPLNAILGYTELILDNIYGDMTDKVRGVLERVQNNGRHLLGLINDVLDLSKIEAGQLALSLTDYSLNSLVQTVFVAVEALSTEKHLLLKIEAPPALPMGHGDERRLSQVLLNLVGNAIKFTDAGEVTIKASAANGLFTVAVHDTGPGVSESDQTKIFEEFQQADSSSTRTKGGTGLGLSIARKIIEMHGGRLWVESTLGNGSTFSFSIPIRVERQAGRA
jgi:signal transduction histidine kinase